VIVPVVRVGILIDVPRATISADHGIVVREADGRERRVQRATFVSVSTSAARSRFRVQIASVTDESAAREIADRARQAGVEPTLRWNAETRTHQLRVGDLATREAAQALSARLAAVGMAGGWVVEEAVDSQPGRLRLLETGDEMTRATWLRTATRTAAISRCARANPASPSSTSSTSRTTSAASCPTSCLRPRSPPSRD
jgi:hypothetical protein